MGCGMSARLKRARPSVSVTEHSTQHEFLCETEGDDARFSNTKTTSSNRRTRSIGSLFYSRKVQNLSDEVASTSAVGPATAVPFMPLSSKPGNEAPSRRQSVPASSVSSSGRHEDRVVELPGETVRHTGTNLHKNDAVLLKVGVVNAKQSSHSQSSDNDDLLSSSILTCNNSTDSGTCGYVDKCNDRDSLDSGFQPLDTASKLASEKDIACDNDEMGLPKLHGDHDCKTMTCDNDRHYKPSKDDVHRNINNQNGVFFSDSEPNSPENMKPKPNVTFSKSYIHKDSGIEVQSDLEKDADSLTSGDIRGNGVQAIDSERRSSLCKCPKQTIGINTLEQIIEVGKMISNPVEHNIIYETAKDVVMTNNVAKSSPAMVITDVADEEAFGPVAKATTSSIEHQHIDNDLIDDELWPGLVVVHVHQDFYNDFDDCFDDEDEILPSLDLK